MLELDLDKRSETDQEYNTHSSLNSGDLPEKESR